MMRVADLTVDEFQTLLKTTLRELVVEIVDEKLDTLIDPDAGLEMRPEAEAELQHLLTLEEEWIDAEVVFGTLELESNAV
jgi:hypothetical protein